MRLAIPLLLLSAFAAGQALPVSGVIVDQVSRSIRPVVALASSVQAGSAKVREFDFAAAAPDGRNALVVRSSGLYVIRRLDGALPVWRELSPEKFSVARAAWSENSESLALVDMESNRLDLWTRMTYEPKRTGSVDLASVTERIVSLAVDKDARFAFAATQGRESGTLYLLKPGQEPLMILPLSKPGVIRLADGALYIADRGRSEVLKLTNWDRMPNVLTLASAGNGIDDPVGFALDVPRRLLYVASGGTRQVLAIDTQSGAVKEVLDLDFAPKALEPLGPGPFFALDGLDSGAPVLDTRAQKAALLPVSPASGD